MKRRWYWVSIAYPLEMLELSESTINSLIESGEVPAQIIESWLLAYDNIVRVLWVPT